MFTLDVTFFVPQKKKLLGILIQLCMEVLARHRQKCSCEVLIKMTESKLAPNTSQTIIGATFGNGLALSLPKK